MVLANLLTPTRFRRYSPPELSCQSLNWIFDPFLTPSGAHAFRCIRLTGGFITRARFLSLSQNVLRNCLSQDSSETGLRSLAVSVFYLCLRQKIVLQIQIQVLVNTLAPIKYLIFLKNPMIKRNCIFTKCILMLGNYCSKIEHKIFVWLFVTQA